MGSRDGFAHASHSLRNALCNKCNKRPIVMVREKLNNLCNELSIASGGLSGSGVRSINYSRINSLSWIGENDRSSKSLLR